MRDLFTDNWNSAWHFIFGVLAIKFWIIIPVFIIYQYIIKYDNNSTIDTLEFAIGYLFAFFIEKYLS